MQRLVRRRAPAGGDPGQQLPCATAPSALSCVGQALAAHPETACVAATTGSSNLVAVVICSGTPELYRYLCECVGALDGVRLVETVPSLRLVKQIKTEGIR
ncbi:Lrp/AsnC ligand binding domain-containing protein [Actinacidiphila glaucinigra]|uniref:Lrp/AsnC ligand binding domain-containing protein n=1 Tax=Actinacidiphila glaucinigra TaxID=235986 RepID=UPI0036DFB191